MIITVTILENIILKVAKYIEIIESLYFRQ